MVRPSRTTGVRRPLIACAVAGSIGALGFVGVSAAASIVTLDKPAQVAAGAAAVRFDPPPPQPPPPPAASSATDQQTVTQAAFVAVNEVRRAAGLTSFQWNDVVALAAQRHSNDMATNRTMSHIGSDGSNAGVRLERAGFAASTWAENIAAGFVDPVALVRAWMASSGHRRHLLGDFTYVGVGTATSDLGIQYWTLDFAT